MKCIRSSPDNAHEILADRIAGELSQNKKVLWMVSGGSNMTISVKALARMKQTLPLGLFSYLTVTIGDERFGPVGHKDSNWKQLQDMNFDFSLMPSVPILRGKSLEETVSGFETDLLRLIGGADVSIGQFGIGADSHIAGILPHTPAVDSDKLAVGYFSGPFTRITLTLNAMRRLSVAYAFVFGESKRDAVVNLQNKTKSVDDAPSQVLKEFDESYLISDSVIE